MYDKICNKSDYAIYYKVDFFIRKLRASRVKRLQTKKNKQDENP